MNRDERIALTEKVRRSENPYQALFGTDAVTARGQRRPTGKRNVLPPRNLLPDPKDRHNLAMKIHQRTLHIMKQLDPDLYRDIFEAEMKLAVGRLATEAAVEPELKSKYNRRLVPAKGSGERG